MLNKKVDTKESYTSHQPNRITERTRE